MQCNIKTIQCAKTLNSKTLYRLLFYYWWWERICFFGKMQNRDTQSEKIPQTFGNAELWRICRELEH